MQKAVALYTSDIFGKSYDDLPPAGRIGPAVFVETVEAFESEMELFSLIIKSMCPVTGSFTTSSDMKGNKLLSLFLMFIRWLGELPEPFLPADVMGLYNEAPSLTAAQQVIASLPGHKRTTFNRFIRLLRTISENLICPVDFDGVFGEDFARQKTCSFFNFLCKETAGSLSFPWTEMKSFLPTVDTGFYPSLDDIGTLDYSKVSVEVPVEMIMAPCESVAIQVAQLYNDTKVRAMSFGLTDEVIENVDDIGMDEAVKLKAELKRILEQFESEYKAIVSKKPSKTDKIPLTALYQMHLNLRKRITTKSKHELLMEEKVALQKELNAYRDEFERKYGHKIETSADKAPVAEKYKRYCQVKRELAELNKK